MAHPVLGDQIYRMSVRHLMHNNAIWNVFHMRNASPADFETLQNMGTDWGLEWAEHMMPLLSDEVTLHAVTVQQLFPVEGPLITRTATGTGGIAGQAVMNQQALVVTLRSASAGRRARGRSFIGGLPEATFDGLTGLWPSADAIAVAEHLDNAFEEFATLYPGNLPCVWSTKAKVAGVLETPQYYPVLSFEGQRIPATMRSRKIGNGI